MKGRKGGTRTRNIKRQEKILSSLAKTKVELKAMDSRMNNAEERISDLKDRIMEITQLKQQIGSQIEKKKKNESNIKDL